jgi:hypothetical protein
MANMFYLETKDGERFLTGANSDDKAEFEKIVESKMGSEAVDLLNQLLLDAYESGEREGITEHEADTTAVSTDSLAESQERLQDIITEIESQIQDQSDVDISDLRVYAEELTNLAHTLNEL